MAVDYTGKQYKTLKEHSTYTKALSGAKERWQNGSLQDYEANISTAKQGFGKVGSVVGEGIGSYWGTVGEAVGGGVGYLSGLALGWAGEKFFNWGDWMAEDASDFFGVRQTAGRRMAITDMKNARDTFASDAITAMQARNQNIIDINYLINSTRNSFNDTYGAGTFDKLEEVINKLVGEEDAGRLSELLSGLQMDNVAGTITSRLVESEYGAGIFTEEEARQMLETNLSLSELGSAYVDYMVEFMMGQDSEIGDASKKLDGLRNDINEDYNTAMKELMGQNAQQFATAFLDAREKNVAGATSLGSTQSEAGASGIKASKSTSGATKMARFRQDMARASYATLLGLYQSSMEAKIQTQQISRDRAYRDLVASTTSLKRQVKASINSSINQYYHGVGQKVDEGNKATNAEMSNVAGAMAYDSELKQIAEEFKDVGYNDDIETILTATSYRG